MRGSIRALHIIVTRSSKHHISLSKSIMREHTTLPSHGNKSGNPDAHVDGFLKFLNSSPSPFHTVQSAKDRLLSAHFKEILERDSWSDTLKPGAKYFLTRNGSSIVAFAIGKKWTPGSPISMIGAHTDSPCLRIKPISKSEKEGFLQVGVEKYGGGLWHTWFDRDLSIAGRVMVKTSKGFQQRLVKVNEPILRIPTLAIHLDRQENFSFNAETQLYPIAGLVAAELNRKGQQPKEDEGHESEAKEASFNPLKIMTERHHPCVVEKIAKVLKVSPSEIVDFEIVLYDTQHACLGGMNEELVFSARLDNLGMSYCATMGLIHSLSSPSALDNETSIRLISLFDHEEIGSETAQGADSNLLPSVLRRLSIIDWNSNKVSPSAYEETLAKSFLISADMAHSVHPNYPEKYESKHRPEMNKGTVIKVNANARYATNSPGIVLLEEVAKRAKPSDVSDSSSGVPLQLFVVRNDSSCGSTIGPMLSAAMGTRTIDVGNPQLSMHSIRECGGAHDVAYGVRLFESFFEHYSEIEQKIFVDATP